MKKAKDGSWNLLITALVFADGYWAAQGSTAAWVLLAAYQAFTLLGIYLLANEVQKP